MRKSTVLRIDPGNGDNQLETPKEVATPRRKSFDPDKKLVERKCGTSEEVDQLQEDLIHAEFIYFNMIRNLQADLALFLKEVKSISTGDTMDDGSDSKLYEASSILFKAVQIGSDLLKLTSSELRRGIVDICSADKALDEMLDQFTFQSGSDSEGPHTLRPGLVVQFLTRFQNLLGPILRYTQMLFETIRPLGKHSSINKANTEISVLNLKEFDLFQGNYEHHEGFMQDFILLEWEIWKHSMKSSSPFNYGLLSGSLLHQVTKSPVVMWAKIKHQSRKVTKVCHPLTPTRRGKHRKANSSVSQGVDLEKIHCRICEKPVYLASLCSHSEKCHALGRAYEMLYSCNRRIFTHIERMYNRKDEMWRREDVVVHMKELLALHRDLEIISEETVEKAKRIGLEIKLLLEQSPLQLSSRAPKSLRKIPMICTDKVNVLEDILQKSKRLHCLDEDGTVDFSALRRRCGLHNFHIIKPISRGAFGLVLLVQHKTSKELFAMKAMKKSDIVLKGHVARVQTESRILNAMDSEHVVCLYYSFEDALYVYLVTEYLPGGDLFALLRVVGWVDEDQAQTFLADCVLSLEYLSKMKVAHRDIKPDNFLIARNGRLKLVDFGLSKFDSSKSMSTESARFSRTLCPEDLVGLTNKFSLRSSSSAKNSPISSPKHMLRKRGLSSRREPSEDPGSHLNSTTYFSSTISILSGSSTSSGDVHIVGTPDYLCPEILEGKHCGIMGDLWALGVMMFEMLIGNPPFHDKSPEKIYQNIRSKIIDRNDLEVEVSDDAKDLMKKLLVRDPHSRLGADGIEELKEHAFFKNIDFNNITPVFVPELSSYDDTSYFEARDLYFPVSDESMKDIQASNITTVSPDICNTSWEAVENEAHGIFPRVAKTLFNYHGRDLTGLHRLNMQAYHNRDKHSSKI